MKDVKVMVATPMYGGMCTGAYTQSVSQLPLLAKEYGVDLSFGFTFNNSLVPHARNTLADIFLRHDFTHLFFIDADIEFKAPDFMSLLAADKPVIAGVYPQKTINWEAVHQAAAKGVPANQLAEYSGTLIVQFIGDHEDRTVPLTEPFEVKGAGTGFMCIKREVFEQLAKHVIEFKEGAGDEERMVKEYFFIRNAPNETQMSEDIAFCWLCRQHGIPIYIAPWVKLGHMGTYTFRGSPVIVEVRKNEL